VIAHGRVLIAIVAAGAWAVTTAHLSAQGFAAQKQRMPLAGGILERCGTVERWRIGASVSPSEFPPANGGITITVANGRIATIQSRVRGTFTQRYIVIGESTLSDVMKRYGSARRSPQSSSVVEVDYPYDGITFQFAGGGSSSEPRVSAVRLHAKAPDPSGADHSCNLK
jgi:hypothetical protein